jgi:hypothetical protein
MSPKVAHRVISHVRNNQVALGEKADMQLSANHRLNVNLAPCVGDAVRERAGLATQNLLGL